MRALILSVLLLSTYPAISQNQQCPCCSYEYRQFDFWIGNWEAYQGEQLAGTNEIVILQDSCIIQENWISSRGGFTGTSYNFYDAKSKTWNQTWIDNQGGNLVLSGKFLGGQMILSSKPYTDPEGNTLINRITWTPKADGTVRQLWELTKDNRNTWTTLFDGLYRKKD